jgi:basic membrane lipoprotein Med (substrate-binding protein (PBP1-ABC) superfamily)
MRVWTFLLFAIVMGAALMGCSPDQQASREPTASGQTSDFKVALLTPGPVSDSGWNAAAFEGLMQIESELRAEVNTQVATGPQITEAMRAYAQQGYNLIFGHGFEYNEPQSEVAPDFPETIFISSSGGLTTPNSGAIRFKLEEGFYLAGKMAALMSDTGKVAMIGGDEVPSIKSTFRAFAAGAKVANPEIEVIEIFTGSGTDVARAKQATLQAIDRGADFVIHQANNAAQGVFDACRERGVMAFGANMNQNDNPSGVVLASAVINMPPVFRNIAKAVKDGAFQPGIEVVGMSDEAILFVVNPALADKIPADVMETIQNTQKAIELGELDVPTDNF